jgi:hypothetical protein
MDGHTRSGTLLFDYSQSAPGDTFYRNQGFKCVVTSSSYVVDGNAVTISKTITNTTASGFNPSITNLTWSITANVSIARTNGILSWNCNRIRTLLNTSDTANVYHGQSIPISWSKARVGITGNASGTTASGENYSANVTSQVVRDFTCAPNAAHPGHHPFINGTLDFTPGAKATRHIDYGYPNNGACDDQALVTISTHTFAITLP